MRPVRRIAIATTVATYLLVVIGGMVRATGSGLGCGNDWPRCNGRIVPLADYHTLIEFSHRFMATVVVIGTVALALAAFRTARHRSDIVIPAVLTVPLVLSQAVLGAVVVNSDLQAESVVAHLLVAMSLLALLIVITVRTGPERSETKPVGIEDSSFATAAVVVGAGVLALLLVGSYVSGRGAGLAFRSWPWFDPTAPGTAHHLHALHRILAAMVGVAVAWLAQRARTSGQVTVVQRLSRAALHLYLVQIVVGAGNVWTRLHPVVATAHLALGAAIWAVVFSTAYLAHRSARDQASIEAPTTVGSPWRPSP